ncbi:MAG: MoxR family ATPase [Deltaproteobacteria bacterium]|nr:MoxR family ATPase [Deltaproteobacteria bacterium]
MNPFDIIRPASAAVAKPAEPITLEVTRQRGDDPFGPYVLSEQLATTVNVSLALDQPLLVTGEPGCGKTALAWAVAAQLGCKVLEFHTKSTSVARDLLYQIDSLRRFHDASTGDAAARDPSKYLAYRALGEAIRSPVTTVVLIDEIDKAPRDFPNDLLNELDRMEFAVPEVDPPLHFRAKAKHFVLITSNSERRLPMPFLRRCVYAHVDFPDAATLAKIVDLHCGAPATSFAALAVERFLELRATDGLVKAPATGELISWVRVLQRLGIGEKHLQTMPKSDLPALETMIKMVDDLRTVRRVT